MFLATGSARRPAMANGCFGIRLTQEAISMENVVPSFPFVPVLNDMAPWKLTIVTVDSMLQPCTQGTFSSSNNT